MFSFVSSSWMICFRRAVAANTFHDGPRQVSSLIETSVHRFRRMRVLIPLNSSSHRCFCHRSARALVKGLYAETSGAGLILRRMSFRQKSLHLCAHRSIQVDLAIGTSRRFVGYFGSFNRAKVSSRRIGDSHSLVVKFARRRMVCPLEGEFIETVFGICTGSRCSIGM